LTAKSHAISNGERYGDSGGCRRTLSRISAVRDAHLASRRPDLGFDATSECHRSRLRVHREQSSERSSDANPWAIPDVWRADGGIEAVLDGVRGRKLGRLWSVSLSSAWGGPAVSITTAGRPGVPSAPTQNPRDDREGTRS
jgi:hypothetical protein